MNFNPILIVMLCTALADVIIGGIFLRDCFVAPIFLLSFGTVKFMLLIVERLDHTANSSFHVFVFWGLSILLAIGNVLALYLVPGCSGNPGCSSKLVYRYLLFDVVTCDLIYLTAWLYFYAQYVFINEVLMPGLLGHHHHHFE